jgi:6-phosphogluconolactonase
MQLPLSPKLLVAPSKAELPSVLCDVIVTLASEAFSKRNKFSIALSGGSLPTFLGKLPDVFAEKGIDPQWDSWHVFLADERCVPVTSDDSNLKAITSNFLDMEGVEIPKDQIYGIDAGLTEKLMAQEETNAKADADATTEAIAVKYEETIRTILQQQQQQQPNTQHTLDLAVLGFGPDGHTCSLFPGHALLDLDEPGKFVASIVDSPKPPPRRITLTLDFLNQHTNHIIVCGAGASKYPIIEKVFDFGDDGKKKTDDDDATTTCQTRTLLPKLVSPPPYPCSMVTPKQSLTWVVDADAIAGDDAK